MKHRERIRGINMYSIPDTGCWSFCSGMARIVNLSIFQFRILTINKGEIRGNFGWSQIFRRINCLHMCNSEIIKSYHKLGKNK